MRLSRIAAFTCDGRGGNPAGVVLLDAPAAEADMRRVARDVGYSETAFLHPDGRGWKIRYFSPELEVPFCGHATIAAGAVLGSALGEGVHALTLRDGTDVTVEATAGAPGEPGGRWWAALQSPPTWSREPGPALVGALLDLFGLAGDDLDPRLPPRIAHAGATHAVIALRSRRRLSHLGYAFAEGRAIQARAGLTTIAVVHAETPRLFHARNPFAVGGVYEDPATGAAAAALAGALRDVGWRADGPITIVQGEDIGRKSRLIAAFGPVPGGSVRVSGETAPIGRPGATGGVDPRSQIVDNLPKRT